MMKRILFVVLPYIIKRPYTSIHKIRSFKGFPYGLLSLSTFIKNSCTDVNIKIIDCNSETQSPTEIFDKALYEFTPNIVGFSMMFDNSYQYLKEFVTTTRSKMFKDVFILLGGAAATASWRQILQEQPEIDAICFGEGEIPLRDVLLSSDFRQALNSHKSWVTHVRPGDFHPIPSKLQDLTSVIDIDYSLININEFDMREAFSPFANLNPTGKQFFIVTSRGCPYKCVFCMRSADNDKSIRYASVDSVINHVEKLVNEYRMKVLTIYDDQILFNKKRAKELFKKLAKFKIRIECPNGLSVAFIDDELAYLMRNAGMDSIYLAIESGSEYILNKVIHKPLKLKMVKPVVDILRKYDFWIQGFFVSGLPGETDYHRNETLNFIRDIDLDWNSFSLAVPSRGSELYKICVEKGYIPKEMDIDALDATRYMIEIPGQSTDYITDLTYRMQLDVNFVNNRSMRNGNYQLAIRVFKQVVNINPNHAFAHYFLSKAYSRAGQTNNSEYSAKRFKEIIDTDQTWKRYADIFGITL